MLDLGNSDVSKDALRLETIRLAALMSRVGRRLKNHIGKLGPHALPDEDTLERAKLAALSKLPELSEAEHQEALEAFRRETILAMTDDEIEKLHAERTKIRAAG